MDELFDRFKPHGVADGGVIVQQHVQHAAFVIDFQGFHEKPAAVEAGRLVMLEQILKLLLVDGVAFRGGVAHGVQRSPLCGAVAGRYGNPRRSDRD